MASSLNLATLKTPGVYLEEIQLFPPSVVQVDTAIPAFIGYTAIAKDKVDDDLINVPKRIKSLLEFEIYFGFAEPEGDSITVTIDITNTGIKAIAAIDPAKRSKHILYYALQLFYANGGGICHIVSVGKFADSPVVALGTPTSTGLLRGLSEIEKIDEPTLLVFPESYTMENANIASLYNEALIQADKLSDRFVIMDAMRDTDATSNALDAVFNASDFFRGNATLPAGRVGNINLKYGASYTPFLVTNIQFRNSIESLVNVIVNRVSPAAATSNVKLDDALITSDLKSKAILAIENLENILPPSAAIAGIYASVDNNRGVWKAPANVSLNSVIKPTHHISDADQEDLNVSPTGKSINAIRSFTGKGILVWGARTLAGNDNEWRYVSVRRFFIMVEESVKKATIPFVFESNDANTWVRIRAMIENFLTLQWRAGALAGAKPDDAFYVKVGLGQTMTAVDILEGRMIIEIGMAVVRPAEFIVLRFAHKMQES